MQQTWLLLISSPPSLISHEARHLLASQPLAQPMIKETFNSTASEIWKSLISTYLGVLSIVFAKLSATQTSHLGSIQSWDLHTHVRKLRLLFRPTSRERKHTKPGQLQPGNRRANTYRNPPETPSEVHQGHRFSRAVSQSFFFFFFGLGIIV